MRHWFFLVALFAGLAAANGALAQQRGLGPLHIGMTYEEVLAVDADGGQAQRPRGEPPLMFVFLRPFSLGGVNFFGAVELEAGRVHAITMQSRFNAQTADECGALASAVSELLELSAGPLDGATLFGGPSASATPISRSILHHQVLANDRHRWAAYSNRDGFTAVTATFNEPVTVRFSGATQGTAPPCQVRIALKPPYPVTGHAVVPDPAALDAAEPLERVRWRTMPDSETALAAYPPLAETFGVTGAVRLECLVIEDQRVQCAATEDEAAAGWGFGAAALALSQQLRIEPEIDGVPTFGRRVGFNMPFRLR